MMRRLTGALVLAVALLSGTAATTGSAAADDCDGWGANGNGDSTEVCGSEQNEETTPGNPGGISIRIPGPWTQRVYTPFCSSNVVTATGPGMTEYDSGPDAMCEGASSCPADDEFRWWGFERPMSAENRAPEDDFGFDRTGPVCRGADDPSETEPPTITVEDIMEKARAMAPTPTFVIEPAAKSYVNIPTNFASNAEAVTVNVVVLGFTIPVEFTPGDVTWSFGDGTTGSGVGVRHASVGQAGAVEHAYARSGSFDVSVTVGYTARVFVPTGPIDIPTPINRTAAPQTLAVGEIQSVVTEVD